MRISQVLLSNRKFQKSQWQKQMRFISCFCSILPSFAGDSVLTLLTSGHRIPDNPPSGTLLFVMAQEGTMTFKGFHRKATHVSLTYISLAKASHMVTFNFKGKVACNPPLCPDALEVLMFYTFKAQFSYLPLVYILLPSESSDE